MPTNHTPNYQLNQWEAEDKVLRTDFNEDNAKIDRALGALTEATTAHGALLPKLGNCAVHVGTYIGKGDTLPVAATVPGRPMAVFVQDGVDPFTILAVRGMESANTISGNRAYSYLLTWGEHTVSWNNGTGSTYSLNYKDRLYFYMILATMDE